jgi:dihydroorotate dehydrogenase electron transfer subunit
MFELLAEILSNERLTHDTWLMALRSPEIARTARPGQFVMIRISIGLDPLLRRPFSICHVKDDFFQVLYRVVGKGTRLMTESREGEKLQVLGPLGKGFAEPEGIRRRLLVGGGIGMAPLVFLSQFHGEKNLAFMMGFRSAKDIISPQTISGKDTGFRVATDDGSQGHHGPVTDLLDDVLREKQGEVAVYACGPKPMLRRVAEKTMPLRISCQVSLEANMACGMGVCQGCAVKASATAGRSYFYVCKEGPVFDADEIDWEFI